MQIRQIVRAIAVLPIALYQNAISPWLPGSCIYTPTCSEYTRQAITKHGIIVGWMLACSRILRCIGTLFDGGYDPVPDSVRLRTIGQEFRKRFRFVGQERHDGTFDN